MSNLRHLSDRSLHAYETDQIAQFEAQLRKDRKTQMFRAAGFLFTAIAILALALNLAISLEPFIAKMFGG